MSSVLPERVPAGWEVRRFSTLITRSKEAGRPDLPPLSVYLTEGVVPRADRDDNHNALGADLSKYLVVRPGDLVFNKLRTWQGGLGVSEYEGIVSPAYYVCRPCPAVEPRYLHHLLRSRVYLAELSRLSKFMPPSQFDIGWQELKALPILVPPMSVQQALADHLDAEAARIDALVSRNRALVGLLHDRFETTVFQRVTSGLDSRAPLRRVCQGWIEEIPAHWGMPTVSMNFDLKLGKMLNPDAAGGPNQYPYLRNINVQWDRFDLEDLATMDFSASERAQLELLEGDVLVCEGGEVGRAAVWSGSPTDCYFQKAVHRLRPRNGANGRFLMYCLRAAAERSVFSVEGNTSTIVHLTGEQLAVHRFPWPPENEQEEIVRALDDEGRRLDRLVAGIRTQVEALHERRQALITALVIGEMAVPGVAT